VTEQVLTADWLLQQHRAAWSTLADEWQDADAALQIQQACDGVAGTGYACLREQGNWSRIRQLGLPVLLVLQSEPQLMLPLRGLAADRVLVGASSDERMADSDEVERQWYGEYMVVWPQAPGWPSEIHRGEAGEAVDIVMAMAAYAEPPWQGSGVFDARFESWLKSFQQRHGLEADGIVGPNTLIYLMAPTIDRPRLRLESEGSS
jgi:general secretion pathway protein A